MSHAGLGVMSSSGIGYGALEQPKAIGTAFHAVTDPVSNAVHGALSSLGAVPCACYPVTEINVSSGPVENLSDTGPAFVGVGSIAANMIAHGVGS